MAKLNAASMIRVTKGGQKSEKVALGGLFRFRFLEIRTGDPLVGKEMQPGSDALQEVSE